jgi:hygromycin-B 7''-O-kinase
MQLPHVPSLDVYRTIYHKEALWRPAIGAICQRHGLTEASFERGPDGTHLVYYVDSEIVVKLFVPLFGADAVAEQLVLRHLQGGLEIQTATILHQGEIDGWRYLVMTRVPGIPLEEAWSGIPSERRRVIARQTGALICHLRSVPTHGLEALSVDWSAFVEEQLLTAVERQRGWNLSPRVLDDIRAYLANVAHHLTAEFPPTLVLADITREHILVSESKGHWGVVGYVDFGDAFVAHPDYELVAPGLDVARGDARLQRELLLGAGYTEEELDEALRQRLMAFTLIHRFVRLGEFLPVVPGAPAASSTERLARILWPLTA